MAVIAISRKFASGGRRLGRHLAKRLGYDYVDKFSFQKIAEDLHVSQATLEAFEMGKQYRVSNLFSKAVSRNYLERIVGHDNTIVEDQTYQETLRSIILQLAEKGNVVLIGRAAHFILKDMENCYRFRLVAPREWREQYAVEYHGVQPSDAAAVVERRDRSQMWFLRSVCGEGFDDPILFHMTLNMNLIPFEQALEHLLMVVNLGEQASA